VTADAAADEFAPIHRGDVVPHVVVTTGLGAGKKASHGYAASLLGVVPNSEFRERRNPTPAAVMRHAAGIGATDVLLVQEDHTRLSMLTHAHLPDGPSAVWRLSSVVEASRIRGHGAALPDRPEVLLNNFSTVLGHRIGRMLGALFGGGVGVAGRARQAVTWHNQQDFVFFRFHRYVFKAEGEKVALQELGPRFTLRLNRLLRGAWGARAKGGGGNHVAPAVQPGVASAAAADRDKEEERVDEDEDGEDEDTHEDEGGDLEAEVGEGDVEVAGTAAVAPPPVSGSVAENGGTAQGSAAAADVSAAAAAPASGAAANAPPHKVRRTRDAGVEWVRSIKAGKDRRKRIGGSSSFEVGHRRGATVSLHRSLLASPLGLFFFF